MYLTFFWNSQNLVIIYFQSLQNLFVINKIYTLGFLYCVKIVIIIYYLFWSFFIYETQYDQIYIGLFNTYEKRPFLQNNSYFWVEYDNFLVFHYSHTHFHHTFIILFFLIILLMKQLVKEITSEQIDTMIILKWHRMVYDPDSPSFVSYSTLGKAYGIDGSSAWRLILKRFA